MEPVLSGAEESFQRVIGFVSQVRFSFIGQELGLSFGSLDFDKHQSLYRCSWGRFKKGLLVRLGIKFSFQRVLDRFQR